jgi:hypothetical protein
MGHDILFILFHVAGPYDRLQAAVPRSSANLTVNPALKGDLHVLYASKWTDAYVSMLMLLWEPTGAPPAAARLVAWHANAFVTQWSTAPFAPAT